MAPRKKATRASQAKIRPEKNSFSVIIPFKKPEKKKSQQSSSQKADVIPITLARDAKIQKERRKSQRIILDEVFSSYLVLKDGLYGIKVNDLTEHGLGIEIQREGFLSIHQKVIIRIYLNRMIYFRIVGQVVRSQTNPENHSTIYGIKIHHQESDPAYVPFVAFLRTLVGHLRKDQGDVLVGIETS